jgi:hypothetical protein
MALQDEKKSHKILQRRSGFHSVVGDGVAGADDDFVGLDADVLDHIVDGVLADA